MIYVSAHIKDIFPIQVYKVYCLQGKKTTELLKEAMEEYFCIGLLLQICITIKLYLYWFDLVFSGSEFFNYWQTLLFCWNKQNS